jgi:hypothetical protein
MGDEIAVGRRLDSPRLVDNYPRQQQGRSRGKTVSIESETDSEVSQVAQPSSLDRGNQRVLDLGQGSVEPRRCVLLIGFQ